LKPLFWLAFVLGLCCVVSRTAAQDSKDSKKTTDSSAKEKESPKPPSLKDILDAGRKVIVFTYQDFNKIDKPNGAFLPGVDASKLKDSDGRTRPTAGGVTRLEITGDLSESWAALNVLVEARIDDPQGGDLVLAFQEAQCSKVELKFHDPAWDASEFVPVEPAPLKKDDVASPYVLRLDKPGSYILRLRLDVEIDRGPLERQLTLTLPKAPVKSVRLIETAAREGIRIEGARRSRTERDVSVDADGKTFIPRLLPDESLDLRWRLVADAAGKGADAAYTVVARSRIRGRQLETTTEIAVQSRRERREWTVRLPDGETPGNVQVLQEGKAIVATMEALKNGGEESRVRIQTADNVAGSIKLLLTSTRPLPSIPASPESAVVELSPATLDGDPASKAFALVSVKDDEEVRVTPSPRQEHGVESVPPESIDAEAPVGPRTAAYQYVRPDAKLPLKLERLKPVLALAAPPTVAFHFEPNAVVVHADFRLLVKQGKLESVVAALPTVADDVRATMDGVARSAAPGAEQPNGVRLWTLAFGERRSGESLLHLTASIPTTGKLLRLPIPFLPDIQESATMVALTKAPGVQVVLAPDELKDFQLVASGPRSANQAWLTLQTRSRGAVLAATTNRFHGKSTAAVEHRLAASDANLRVTTTIRWENRVEPFSEVKLTIPEGVAEAVVKGERLAAPPGGIALGPGPAKLPLAAPSESCTVVVEYVTPIAKEGTTAVPLTTPVGDVIASCFAELRAQPGRRPLTPPTWEATSPERHLGELLDPENPYVGLLVRSESPPASLSWKSEPAGSLAEIVVPRMMIAEDLTGSGRRRGRLLAVLAHRRTPACEILLPPGCTVAETYLDGKLAPVVSSTRGERPSLTLRLPNDDRPVSLEIRYEATCKSLSAARNLSLAVPKFGGDVVVDQVLWRIATPTNVLLGTFGDEVTTPAPNLWRFDRRLPGIWGFEPILDESNVAKSMWLDGSGGNLEWAPAPSDLFQNRRWSFMTWGNAGSLNVTAIREPFWILAASALVLAAAGGVLSAKRRYRPWVASGIGFLVGLVWLISPRAMAWFWIGGRWAIAALAVGLIGWSIRAIMQERRRQRLAKRSLTFVTRNTVPTTPALAGPSGSSLKRKATVEPSSH
jgi:hypothetical protein